MVTVSVPGKIHLMGEHAVVYGRPALLAAINKRMRVSVQTNTSKNSNPITVVSTEPSSYAVYAAEFVMDTLHIQSKEHIAITIDSDIPAGFHLGSSAAVASGVAGALMYFYKHLWNPIKINELAYEIEKKQHGNPSGGDNTVVCMGGLIWYRKELEFLRSIWQLPYKPHVSLNHFFLINTGRPQETTGEMVSFVKSQISNHNFQKEIVFHQNEEQTKRITVALKEGNENELIDAMRIGEHTLETMGVVNTEVMSVMRTIEKTGSAVKILGGGGRASGVGYMLCYTTDKERIKSICNVKQWGVEEVLLGEEGIRLDEK